MRFGIREICNVVLRAKSTMTLGSRKFYKNEPVLYFETLKTSSLEGASTTVYATGGRGNTRLVAWEGERTLTFTMEDALISPESFSILSGAGLIAVDDNAPIYVHTTSQVEVKKDNTIELPEIACWNRYDTDDEYYHQAADIFVMTMKDGEIAAEPCIPASIDEDHMTLTCYSHAGRIEKNDVVLVDYYVKRTGGAQLIEITADKFGGNYYLEAQTLFRRESDGVDMPAEFIIPNCKVQSNFTFTMAATGDPSTFTFTLDAFPDYTKFDKTHKVLAAIQVITDESEEAEESRTPCKTNVQMTAYNEDVELTYDNDSTETYTKITATGTGISGAAGVDYETAVFGDLGEKGVKAVQVEFELPVDAEEKYRIVQMNPVLKYYYPDDKDVARSGSNYIKTKEYDGSVLAENTYGFLVSDETGPITIKVFKLNGTKGELVKTITVKNSVTFAADADAE